MAPSSANSNATLKNKDYKNCTQKPVIAKDKSEQSEIDTPNPVKQSTYTAELLKSTLSCNKLEEEEVVARPIFLQQKIEGVETSTRTTQKSPNAIPKVFTTHFGITWEPLITQKPKNHEWSADFKIFCQDIGGDVGFFGEKYKLVLPEN